MNILVEMESNVFSFANEQLNAKCFPELQMQFN